jgi:hypothetical protein
LDDNGHDKARREGSVASSLRRGDHLSLVVEVSHLHATPERFALPGLLVRAMTTPAAPDAPGCAAAAPASGITAVAAPCRFVGVCFRTVSAERRFARELRRRQRPPRCACATERPLSASTADAASDPA